MRAEVRTYRARPRPARGNTPVADRHGDIQQASRSVLPQAFAQCRSRTTGSVPAAALKLRHQQFGHVAEATGRVRGEQHEAVAAALVDVLLHLIGDVGGSTDSDAATGSIKRLTRRDANGRGGSRPSNRPPLSARRGCQGPLSERPPTREMSRSAVEFAQLCLCNHDESKWVVTARKNPRHAGACGGFTLVCYVAFTLPSRGPRRAASAWWPTPDGSPSTKPGRRHQRCRSRRAPSPSWWCG
jgi:hypothetical protein